MVTPAMQQQPPPVIYGPNGERAEWNGREYIVAPSAAPQAVPAGPQQGPIPGLIQMETPQQRIQAEERAYDRQRDEVRDAAAARREERSIEANARAAEAADRSSRSLTEGQSKAVLYGRMMRGAEADYQAARERGYDPGSFRNAAANMLDAIPWDGGMIPALIRDDEADAGYQAERRWVEANLRQLTGAAAPDSEVTRVQGINFDRANDSLAEQRYRTRQDAYGATRTSLGHASGLLPEDYPAPVGLDAASPDAEARPVAPGALSVGTSYDARAGRSDDELRAAGFEQDESGAWKKRWTPEELEGLGYTYDPQGQQWIPPGGDAGGPPPPAGPQGGPETPQGGDPQSQGYQIALEQERANADLVAKAGGGYGMTDALTGEFNDELAYGAGYLAQGLGNIGRRLTGREIEVSASERGRAARDVMVEDRETFARERPVQNALGNVLGGAAFGPQGAARTMVGRAAQGGGIGATYGFAGAEGSVVDRLPSAAGGAAIGAVATPLVERVAAPAINALARPVVGGVQSAGRFVGRQAGNVGNALGVPGAQRLSASMQPNPLQSGMNRFADRMGPERVNALNPNLATARNNGLNEADLIDILDDGSIGRMRALGTRDTPARDVAVQSAEARRRNLPSRVARIASEEISQDSRPALQAIDDLSATRRANASAIDSFGGDTVPVTPDVVQALRSDFVRPFLRQAATRAQGATDPAERDAAARLTNLAETALDNPAGVQFTVREAQDVSKALNDAATAAYRNGSPDGPILANLARTIRQTARDNSTGYASWLKQYGDDSDLIEAAATGRNFVSVSRDPASARGTEAFVNRGQGASPPEQAIMRTAAREAVETAGSNPSGARTVLEGFANDTGQARRAAAIGADPRRLQERAGAELDSVTRHQRASPRIGSETATNAQDAAGAAIGTARDVMTGNAPALAARVMNAVRSRGFSNQEAEAIVRAANDPAQTDQLVSMLAERMSRRDARSLARALRYQITTNPPASQQ